MSRCGVTGFSGSDRVAGQAEAASGRGQGSSLTGLLDKSWQHGLKRERRLAVAIPPRTSPAITE